MVLLNRSEEIIMKTAAALFALILGTPAAYADSPPVAPPVVEAPLQTREQSRKSEQGAFVLELVLGGEELKIGPNSLDIVLRDKDGRGVEGAQLSVTPWMPTMGHGVWEKPLVRERGGGSYHVENVVIIMGGLWELKVAVKKGELEDLGVFSFTVVEAEPARQEPGKPQAGYDRSLAEYNVPDVTLINQDGKKVPLKALIESGKPVIVDFIFTTCTTVCPILSAGFASLRRELGEKADEVQLISISIDPENDRPEKLKRYLERFGGGAGWEFLTGSRDEVGLVLKAFDAFVTDTMSHQPLYLLRAPGAGQWVRIKGLIKKSDLLGEYRRLENR
jgi:protein SCO1/2